MDESGPDHDLQGAKDGNLDVQIQHSVLAVGDYGRIGPTIEGVCTTSYGGEDKGRAATRTSSILHANGTEDSGDENAQHFQPTLRDGGRRTGTPDSRKRTSSIAELEKFPDKTVFWPWDVSLERQGVPSVRDLLVRSKSTAEFLQKLRDISREDLDSIERLTKGLSENEQWFKHRKYIITGSVAHTLMNAMRHQRFNHRTFALISKEESKHLPYPALEYGQTQEHIARNEFIARKDRS